MLCFLCRVIGVMAIYHFTAKIIKRSDGRSAVKAAAYRHATKMFDENLGETHNYSSKQNVIHCEVIVPDNAPSWAKSIASSSEEDFEKTHLASETLWNKVEHSEKRKDAQLAREFEFSLPIELNETQNLCLARAFIKDQFVEKGMIADFAIHWEDGNPHVHVMLSMRELVQEGFGLKVREWNSKEFLNSLRAEWANYANLNLKMFGFETKIDHRSFVDQGVDLQPSIHEGIGTKNMNERGIELERVAMNKEIRSQNYAHIHENPEALLHKVAQTQERFHAHHLAYEIHKYLPEKVEISKAEIDQLVRNLESKYAVFSERDIQKTIHEKAESHEEFLNLFAKVKAHEHLINLGVGEDGRNHYTTIYRFKQEAKMLDQAEKLSLKSSHVVNQKLVEQKIAKYGLNNSQNKALRAIVLGGYLSLVVGKAGTGKTYMMKVAKDIWEASGFKVHGVSLSGIAAEGLENDAGISSHTLHAFKYRLDRGYLKLDANDIVVMDEAGMTDSDDMAILVNAISKAGAKLSVIGDLEQTQSLGAGSGLKSLMSTVDFVEMDEILRQKIEAHRIATGNLSNGQTGRALDYYHQAGHIHFSEDKIQSSQDLVSRWASDLSLENLQNRIILAHQNKSVAELNLLAREEIVKQGWIRDPKIFKLDGRALEVGVNERLLFLKNNKPLGVRNGSFGSVTAVSGNQISVRLDNGKAIQFSAKEYEHFTYGYAATVHKTQGVTKDQVFVQVDGYGWDRHLAYVALSRHKSDVQVFVSKEFHRSLEALKTSLSRVGIKDAIIDYPLGFGIRRGFDADESAHRAASKISLKDKVIDSWLYLTNYQAYLERVSERAFKPENKNFNREEARKVAAYADISKEVRAEYLKLKASLGPDQKLWDHPGYEDFQELKIKQNALGHEIYQNKEVLAVAIEKNRLSPERLERDSKAHERLVRAESLVNAIQRKDFDEAFKMASEIEKDRAAHYPVLLRSAKLASVDMREINKIIDETIKHAKPDLYKNKSSVELMGRLFDLDEQYMEAGIKKFNYLEDEALQKTLDEKIEVIEQEQRAIVKELKKPERWDALSEQADVPMLSQMDNSEIRAAIKQGNLSRDVMGEALAQIEKIERKVGSGNSQGQSMNKSRGRSR